MTDWQVFWIVAPKVVLICGLPFYLGVAAFEYWKHNRSKKKASRGKRAASAAE